MKHPMTAKLIGVVVVFAIFTACQLSTATENPSLSTQTAPSPTFATPAKQSGTEIPGSAGIWDSYMPRSLSELLQLAPSRIKKPEQKGIYLIPGGDLPSRMSLTYTGKFREIEANTKFVTSCWMLDNYVGMSNEQAQDAYAFEGLFLEDNREYWLPVKADLIPFLKGELTPGDMATVFVFLMGGHDLAEQTAWTTPVQEFLSPQTTQIEAQPETPVPTDPVDASQRTISGNGVSLVYPSSWKLNTPGGVSNPVYDEPYAWLEAPEGNGTVVLRKMLAADALDLETYVDNQNSIFEGNPDTEVITTEKTKIGDLDAVIWTYSYPLADHPEQRITAQSAITMKHQYLYLFSYYDDPEPFDKYHPEVDRMLASVRFIPDTYDSSEGEVLYCPSSDDQAYEAFNNAMDAEGKGQFDEAEQYYLQAIEIDPNYCDAMDNLGLMLRKQGRVGEAIKWYQKSLDLSPYNTLARRNLAYAYAFQDNTEQAVREFIQVIQIDPDDPEGYYGLGVLAYAQQLYLHAIINLSQAEQYYLQIESPEVVDAQYILGNSYFLIQDCAHTKSYLEPIYTQRQDDGQINYDLGVCYLQSSPIDRELAKEYFLKAEKAGFSIPNEMLVILAKEYGQWPPK